MRRDTLFGRRRTPDPPPSPLVRSAACCVSWRRSSWYASWTWPNFAETFVAASVGRVSSQAGRDAKGPRIAKMLNPRERCRVKHVNVRAGRKRSRSKHYGLKLSLQVLSGDDIYLDNNILRSQKGVVSYLVPLRYKRHVDGLRATLVSHGKRQKTGIFNKKLKTMHLLWPLVTLKVRYEKWQKLKSMKRLSDGTPTGSIPLRVSRVWGTCMYTYTYNCLQRGVKR